MNSLSPKALALIEAGRAGHEPDAAARARVLKALAQKAGGMSQLAEAKTQVLSTPEAEITVPKAVVKVPMGPMAKSLLFLGACTFGTIVALFGQLKSDNAPRLRLVDPANEITAQPVTRAFERRVTEANVDEVPEPPVQEKVATVAAAKPKVLALHPTRDSLQAELKLLRNANESLKNGDANACLASLSQHEKEFPRGVLAEERNATQILALCKAGRTSDAVTRANAFTVKYPHSPLTVRIRHSCVVSEK